MALAAGHDSDAVGALNHGFHREVNLAANCDHLARLLASIVKHFPNRFYTEIEGQVQACRTEHPLILQALRAHDANRSRSLMQDHIGCRGDQLVAMLHARGVWPDGTPMSDLAPA